MFVCTSKCASKRTPSPLLYIAVNKYLWRSEMIMGFREYTYQDHEYIIRAMNTKHAQSTCLYIQLVTKPWVFLFQGARKIALCHSEHICDQVAPALVNKLHLNTALTL